MIHSMYIHDGWRGMCLEWVETDPRWTARSSMWKSWVAMTWKAMCRAGMLESDSDRSKLRAEVPNGWAHESKSHLCPRQTIKVDLQDGWFEPHDEVSLGIYLYMSNLNWLMMLKYASITRSGKCQVAHAAMIDAGDRMRNVTSACQLRMNLKLHVVES